MSFYVAYGSNLDSNQMKSRCPNSKFVKYSFLQNSRLVFSQESRRDSVGFASLDYSKGSKALVAIYETPEQDEYDLDSYEGACFTGVHRPYIKKYLDKDHYIYLGNSEYKNVDATPKISYLYTIFEGYKQSPYTSELLDLLNQYPQLKKNWTFFKSNRERCYRNITYNNVIFDNLSLRFSLFENCVFNDCSFVHTDMSLCTLKNVQLLDSDTRSLILHKTAIL